MVFSFLPAELASATNFQITTTSLSSATVGQTYIATINYAYTGSGSISPYFSNLPSWLGLSSSSFNDGQGSIGIGGLPTQTGTYNFSLTITDTLGDYVNKSFSVTVNSSTAGLFATPTSLNFTTSQGSNPVSQSIQFSNNGSVTASWNVYKTSVPSGWFSISPTSGSTPGGSAGYGFTVSIDATGLIPGTYAGSIAVTGNFTQINIALFLTVTSPGAPLQITTTNLPDATIGQSYNTVIQGSGGVGPYTWTTISTTYPSGCCVLGLTGNSQPLSAPYVTFNTQSGSTVVNTYSAGTYSWVLKLMDSVGNSVTKAVNLNIKAATASSASFQINTTQLPAATVGAYYNGKIDFQYTTNGTNYASNATFSGLPSGITTGSASNPNANYGIVYNNPGSVTISGTPTTVGTYTVTLNLTDQYSANISKQFTLVVNPIVESTPASSGINLPDGTIIKIPGDPTVYLVTKGQLKPFSSAEDFLSQGYTWSQIQQVSPSQISTGSSGSGFYPYPSGSLINDNGTIYFISGHSKIPFTNWEAFVGLGYLLKNVVEGDLTSYTLATNYFITTANAAHPWGSWVIHLGTVYYSSQEGLIGVPSSEVFTSNGGNWNLLVKANSYDVAALNANPNLPTLKVNDSRVYTSSAQ